MKKLILTTLGMVFAASSFASALTLVNSTSASIDVRCNNIQGVTLTPGMTLTLPWALLQFKFQSNQFDCYFSNGTPTPSKAHVNISGNTGMLSSIDAEGVTLDFGSYNPSSHQYASDINVQIKPIG